MDLFDNNFKSGAPLAEKMRPTTLDEFIGQSHILYKNSFLSRAISTGKIPSCIFYGPPGCGKTTLANIIVNTNQFDFKKLNAVSSGVSDAKAVISEAKSKLKLYGTRTILLLDECHRWSKSQSDCMLEAIEEGSIIFIGSTTENPYINMTRAIVSRCAVFEFMRLDQKDIFKALKSAITSQKGFANLPITLTEDGGMHLANIANGDMRVAFNALELAVQTTPKSQDGQINLTKQVLAECIQKRPLALDQTTSYDMLSAFCKSLRGSDSDAALFYAQKLLYSGYDPLIIARRLIAHASEDIGMADSNALLIAQAALYSVQNLGMPECNLTLSHAIIYICEAEKSSSVYNAMHKSMQAVIDYPDVAVPNALKNHPSLNDDKTGGYLYPHDFGGYVKQVYMPAKIKNLIFYKPHTNGREKGLIRKKSKFFKID